MVSFKSLLLLAGLAMAMPKAPVVEKEMLAERGVSKNPLARDMFSKRWVCCDGHCVYKLVGNGDPHTDYFHKQVSDKHNCGAGGEGDTCSVSYLTSYTIGYSINVGGSVGWFSGGFSVQESVTTGNTYTCNAAADETVCVWVNIPHTAYTVEKGVDDVDYCDNQPDGPLVMESPTGEMDYYCVRGDACRNNGEGYWCYGTDGC